MYISYIRNGYGTYVVLESVSAISYKNNCNECDWLIPGTWEDE